MVTALEELWKRNKACATREGKPILTRGDRVFEINRGLLEALRKDARWAELGDYDAQGRRTTFHGFRASTCTMLHREGVALAVAVRIMRHADPKLTINTYAKLDGLADGHRELSKMAVPKVTAVPIASTPASTSSVPQRATVGCSVPLAASGTEIARRVEAMQAQRVAPDHAAPCHSLPEVPAGGDDGGRCRSRTCDPQLVELML